jgi:hypothetical protein
MVRRGIGASLTGDAMLEQRQSTYIRAPDLLRATPTKGPSQDNRIGRKESGDR